MLAYVFWHRPLAEDDAAAYEQALAGFHRSLARSRPVGMRGSAAFGPGALPWREPGRAARTDAYEDWYLLEDWAALGVLGEAAVGRGHRTSHDRAARGMGWGTGGLYRLIEGEIASGAGLGAATGATWVSLPRGVRPGEVGGLLGDGLDPARASLWQRQLVLGPAPEWCLLGPGEQTPGVSQARLPPGSSSATLPRRTLFCA
jgi:hypothetical protein